MNIEKAEELLNTYSLETLFELNDLNEAEVLCFLLEHRKIRLPEVLPLEFNNESSN